MTTSHRRPAGISTRSVRDPNPIVHLVRQSDDGKWRTLCNGGLVALSAPASASFGRPCTRCDAKRLIERHAQLRARRTQDTLADEETPR